MPKAKVTEINNNVQRVEVPVERDSCEACGTSLANLPSDMWWGDQDGIHAVCPECGHTTIFLS